MVRVRLLGVLALICPLFFAGCPDPLPAAPGPLAEKNVRPGFNKRFKSSSLNIKKFLRLWEDGGRGIYVERSVITEALNLKPGQTVADIGAGTGLFVELLARGVTASGRVYAVDISPKFVAYVAERARKAGLTQVEARLGKDRSADLPAGVLDVAFVCATYHHFEYPRSMIESLHASMKVGGELIVIDFERIEGVSDEWTLKHVRAGKDEVIKEITGWGFEFVEEVSVAGLKKHYMLRFKRV